VRNLSVESLCWEPPEVDLPLAPLFGKLQLSWDLHVDREKAFDLSRANARAVHCWLMTDPKIRDADTETLGFHRHEQPGKVSKFEVHSVRPVRRIGPDGQQRTDVVVEITQSWKSGGAGESLRGGCTLLIDPEKRAIRYVIRKRVGHPGRVSERGW
jgi:hypothetical protein